MRFSRTLSVLLLALAAGGFLLSSYALADTNLPGRPHQFEVAAYPSWVFLIWGVGMALHWLLSASFPNRTERLTTLFTQSPWKCLLIGLVNMFILAVILGITLEKVQPLGLILSIIVVVALFVGIHGRSRALGRKILKASGHEPGAFGEVTVGWSAVAFLCAIPYIGWTVLFAYFFAGGLGAVTFSFFKKTSKSGSVDLDSHEL